MGLLAKQSGKFRYLNAVDGSLKDGDAEYGGFAGVITGVRTRENVFNQKKTVQLQVRMIDPEQDNAEPVVISGTMIAGDGVVTTFGRMLISRLVKKGNTGKGEPIEIGVYAGGETRATCVSLRRSGQSQALHGADLKKENPVECRRLTERAVEYLISIYGTFGRESDQVDGQSSGPINEDEFESRESDTVIQSPAPTESVSSVPLPTDSDREWKGFDKEEDSDLPF